MKEVKIFVVGAGPAGLAVSALLTQAGLNYKIIEKAHSVGYSWKTHYERVHLHTVKELSHLPLKPFPSHYPRYVPRDLFVEYMENYAKHFNILPQFDEELKMAKKDSGKWRVFTSKEEYLVEHLIICSGYNHSPKIPHWEGESEFQGEIIHSKNYRNPLPFHGKKVLIVGVGNTGGELAIDLVEQNVDVSLCVRSPLRVVPREIFGIPMQWTAYLLSKIPLDLADSLSQFLLHLTTHDLKEFGIERPKFGSIRQVKEQEKIPLVDIGTVQLIRDGKLKVLPNIRKFYQREIEFENGKVEKFDTVLLCTGFEPQLKALFPEENIFTEKGYPIIRGKEALDGLYFLGFTNHVSGFLRYIGVEAKNIVSAIQSKE